MAEPLPTTHARKHRFRPGFTDEANRYRDGSHDTHRPRSIDPNDLVREYLPPFACKGKEEVRIRHLLTHTSGLPAYTNAAALKDQHGNPCPDAVIEKICSLEAQSMPGEVFQYSCLGYITLAEIVKVVSGQDIAVFTQTHIFTPLGMKHTTFNPPPAWQDNIAATEIVDGQLLCGSVHDPLAQLRNGTSGNAGLFSTAKICQSIVACC